MRKIAIAVSSTLIFASIYPSIYQFTIIIIIIIISPLLRTSSILPSFKVDLKGISHICTCLFIVNRLDEMLIDVG
jgi:hypothetical protein